MVPKKVLHNQHKCFPCCKLKWVQFIFELGITRQFSDLGPNENACFEVSISFLCAKLLSEILEAITVVIQCLYKVFS